MKAKMTALQQELFGTHDITQMPSTQVVASQDSATSAGLQLPDTQPTLSQKLTLQDDITPNMVTDKLVRVTDGEFHRELSSSFRQNRIR